MFTGIIETLGRVKARRIEGTNLVLTITATLDEPIRVDQSIAHNGACLTVASLSRNPEEGEKEYEVVAVQETLDKTALNRLQTGDPVNIERCLKVGQRLDGHFVQGHVDTVGMVTAVGERDGSWMYHFRFPDEYAHLMVDKGSVCINGVSLTVIDATKDSFAVTIIPYTYEHTNFHHLKVGDPINLEFDILGKYILKANSLKNFG